jgi:hypothetical protein
LGLTDYVDGHERVTAGGVLVELMGARFSIFDTLIEDSYEIIDAGTINDDEILNKETIGSIPTTMKDTGGWV